MSLSSAIRAALPSFNLSSEHLGSKGGDVRQAFAFTNEPQRGVGHLWFPDLGTIFGDFFSLMLALKSADIPTTTQNVLEVHHFNQKTDFLGAQEVEPMNVVFNDFVDTPVMETIEGWRVRGYNPRTGAVGTRSDRPGGQGYASTGYLMLLPPDGSSTSLRIWQLLGCFPFEIDRGRLEYGSNAVNEISLTLSVAEVVYLSHGPIPVDLALHGTSRIPMLANFELPMVRS